MCPISITAPKTARRAAVGLLTWISKAVGEVPVVYAIIDALKPAASRAILKAVLAVGKQTAPGTHQGDSWRNYWLRPLRGRARLFWKSAGLMGVRDPQAAGRQATDQHKPIAVIITRINAEPSASAGPPPGIINLGDRFQMAGPDLEDRRNANQRSQR
jgi:hypothetical protein